MTERPILFSGPMVRAILDGRKTQTRRALEEQRTTAHPVRVLRHPIGGPSYHAFEWRSVYGNYVGECAVRYARGDKLWVRETWAHPDITTADNKAIYRADYQEHPDICKRPSIRWRPSIHMPKWAARIWLTVTEVRVQRVQDISEEDALAEGCEEEILGEQGRASSLTAYGAFCELWDSIHGPGAFERNDWVAAISFERAS